MKVKLFIGMLFFKLSVFSQQIDIFNVGMQDKPMNNLTISWNGERSNVYPSHKYIVVDKKEFYQIVNYLRENDTYKIPSSKSYQKEDEISCGGHKFGSYAVQIIDGKKNLLYFMEGFSESSKFFRDFIAFLNKSGYKNTAEVVDSYLLLRVIIPDEQPRNENKIAPKEDNSRLFCWLSIILNVVFVALLVKKTCTKKC